MPYNLKAVIPQDELSKFCKRNHIKKLALFGSALRDEMTPESDIDLLVEFEKDCVPGYFGFIGMEIELTEKIGRKVDLRTPNELSRYFRDKVVKSASVQYES